MVFWDEITDAVAADYPDVTVSRMHIDAMAAKMVMAPPDLDVVVASNLVGDILTDLVAAIWSAAMTLEHLGEDTAASAILKAIEHATAKGIGVQQGGHSKDVITDAILTALEA